MTIPCTDSSPIVSVIITTNNRHHVLGRAIDSVLRQTFTNFELMIVDDGSDIPVESVVKEFKDSRIKIYRHPESRGLPAGRNTGICHTTGQYIAFLDDDDVWYPDRLAKTVRAMDKADDRVGVVYCKCSIFKHIQNKETFGRTPSFRGNVYRQCLERTIIASPCALIRRSCFEQVGVFDEHLAVCEDWDMWIRLARRYAFECVDEFLARYYLHGQQMSVNPLDHIPGREYILSKYFAELKKCPRILARHYQRLGIYYRVARDYPKAVDYIQKAVKVNPWVLFEKSTWGVLLRCWTNLKSV